MSTGTLIKGKICEVWEPMKTRSKAPKGTEPKHIRSPFFHFNALSAACQPEPEPISVETATLGKAECTSSLKRSNSASAFSRHRCVRSSGVSNPSGDSAMIRTGIAHSAANVAAWCNAAESESPPMSAKLILVIPRLANLGVRGASNNGCGEECNNESAVLPAKNRRFGAAALEPTITKSASNSLAAWVNAIDSESASATTAVFLSNEDAGTPSVEKLALTASI